VLVGTGKKRASARALKGAKAEERERKCLAKEAEKVGPAAVCVGGCALPQQTI